MVIVASLPRSGTTTACAMAKILGMNPVYVSSRSFPDLLNAGFDFFSDTPYYCPFYLMALFQHHQNIKVIYLKRPLIDVECSIKGTILNNYHSNVNFEQSLSREMVQDVAAWREVNNPEFRREHFGKIKNLCLAYNIPILNYYFDEGWEPFCRFLGKPVPNDSIPHLNKNWPPKKPNNFKIEINTRIA